MLGVTGIRDAGPVDKFASPGHQFHVDAGIAGPASAFTALAFFATNVSAETHLDAAEPGQQTIEEIIVTATRRDSALQETALSVGVLTERALDEARALNWEDYWRQIPSVAVTDSGPFGTRIAIRGLSANASARSDESLTAVYLDDTFVTPPEGFFTAPPDFYLVDMERVEVLRGPQGTLFGASSMGGAVRNITNRPDPIIAMQRYEGTVSNTNHGGLNYEVNATLNQPIVEDRAAVRLVAYYRDADGYVDDIGLNRSNVNSNRTAGFRLSANTKIGDNFLATGKIVYQDVEWGSFNEVDPNGKPEIGLPTTNDYQLALFLEETRSDKAILYNVDLEYTTSWADWTSVTSWFENEGSYVIDISDEMNFFFGDYMATAIAGKYDQRVFTQEFRAASNSDGPLQWLGGFFYLDQEVPREDFTPAPGFNTTSPYCLDSPSPPPPADAPLQTCSGFPDGQEDLGIELITATREDLGLFGELSYTFAERWEASVGARWYRIDKTLKGLSDGLFFGGFGVVTDLASDEDGINGKGSLAFRINEDTMIYALASQGFRPGGGNDPSVLTVCPGASVAYESDSLWNYELGARTTWLGKQLTLNGTVYHIDWSDAQIVVVSFDCPGTFVDNVGQATSDGVELEFSALIGDYWELIVGAGYTDAKLKEDIPTVDIDAPAGTEMPNVPGITASLGSTNRFPAFRGFEGFVRADVQYTGSSYSSIDLNTRVKKPSYALVNLRGGIENDRWRAELFVENLTDEQAILFCCRLNGEFVTNRPRTIGIRASYSR